MGTGWGQNNCYCSARGDDYDHENVAGPAAGDVASVAADAVGSAAVANAGGGAAAAAGSEALAGDVDVAVVAVRRRLWKSWKPVAVGG